LEHFKFEFLYNIRSLGLVEREKEKMME